MLAIAVMAVSTKALLIAPAQRGVVTSGVASPAAARRHGAPVALDFFGQKESEKERIKELRRMEEFEAMKRRDKSAAIISLGLPAAVSVIFAAWLVSEFVA